jgi:uncharacterized Tic20 family protein
VKDGHIALLIICVIIAFAIGITMDIAAMGAPDAQPVAMKDDPMTLILIGFAALAIPAFIFAWLSGAMAREGRRTWRDE